MTKVFSVKLRKIGTSVGLLVPKEQLESLHVEIGDKVDIVLLKHKNPDEIEKGFGIAKHFSKSFERDKDTREF